MLSETIDFSAFSDAVQPVQPVRVSVARINGVALNAESEVLALEALRQRAYTELLRQAAIRDGLLDSSDAPAVEGVRAQARLVALNDLLEVNCALLIDRLVGLRGVEAFTDSRAPEAGAPAWLGHAYIDAAGEQWQEVNLQQLSQQSRFLSIGA